MAVVRFTPNLQRHAPCPDLQVEGETVAEVLNNYFEVHDAVRGYVLDDQDAIRHHMVIFVDGVQISDPIKLTDRVGESAEVFIFQALSGG